MRIKVPAIVLMSMLMLFFFLAFAQTSDTDAGSPMMSKPVGNIEEFVGHNASECAPDGVGLGGFDAVSYRSESGPVQGAEQYEFEFEGLTYRFLSAENRAAFAARPTYYLPRYSGWCAVTLALGRLTCPDYTSFKIENDELLLFEVTGFTNGRTLWDTDAQGYRIKADDNFLKLLSPAP